jgi:hypothetical protein
MSGTAYGGWFGLVPEAKVGPPLEGRVLYEDTKQPVEGALVVIRWQTDNWNQPFCPYIVTTTTDSEGRFVSPGWKEWGQHLRTYRLEPDVYMRGYEDEYSPTDGVVYMKRSAMSSVERIQYMSRFETETSCDAKENNYNRLPLTKAFYDEAQELMKGMSPEEMRLARMSEYAIRRGLASDTLSREKIDSDEERAYRVEALAMEMGN